MPFIGQDWRMRGNQWQRNENGTGWAVATDSQEPTFASDDIQRIRNMVISDPEWASSHHQKRLRKTNNIHSRYNREPQLRDVNVENLDGPR